MDIGPDAHEIIAKLGRAIRLFAASRDTLPFLLASKDVCVARDMVDGWLLNEVDFQAFGLSDENGELAIHHAIAANNVDIALMLIPLMSVAQINTANLVGDTPLHLAITHKQVCQCLLCCRESQRSDVIGRFFGVDSSCVTASWVWRQFGCW